MVNDIRSRCAVQGWRRLFAKSVFGRNDLDMLDNSCVISNEIPEYSANVPILVKYH